MSVEFLGIAGNQRRPARSPRPSGGASTSTTPATGPRPRGQRLGPHPVRLPLRLARPGAGGGLRRRAAPSGSIWSLAQRPNVSAPDLRRQDLRHPGPHLRAAGSRCTSSPAVRPPTRPPRATTWTRTPATQRTREYIQIVKQAWTSDEPFDFDGQHYQLENFRADINPDPADRVRGSRSAVRRRRPTRSAPPSPTSTRCGASRWPAPASRSRPSRRQPRRPGDRRPTTADRVPADHRADRGAGLGEGGADPRAASRPGKRRAFRSADCRHGSAGERRLAAAARRGRRRANGTTERCGRHRPALTGGGGNSTALVGTPETVAAALLDYYDLGITLLSARGYDIYDDAIDFGRYVIPLVREEVARRGARQSEPKHGPSHEFTAGMARVAGRARGRPRPRARLALTDGFRVAGGPPHRPRRASRHMVGRRRRRAPGGGAGGRASSTTLRSPVRDDGRARGDSLLWVRHGERVVELLRRGGRLAVRVRDPRASNGPTFAGVPAFDNDPSWVDPPASSLSAPRRVEVGTARGDLGSTSRPSGSSRSTSRGAAPADRGRARRRTGVLFRDETNGAAQPRGGPWPRQPPTPGQRRRRLQSCGQPALRLHRLRDLSGPARENRLDLAVTAGERAPA